MARKQKSHGSTEEKVKRVNHVLGPPPTEGLKPLAIATRARKGKWIWEPVKQTKKDKKLRARWEKRMAKADRRGESRFDWPPDDD